MTTRIAGICSMATYRMLVELAAAYRPRDGVVVEFATAGGLDVAKRIQDGEPFDVVVLAANAIEKLIAGGSVVAGSKTDLARSGMAIAVRAGAPRLDIASEDSLRRAVLSARAIGYSTGPSGVALAKLFENWGIAETVRARMVQTPPGIPVGRLLASGEVELGFQQFSELKDLPGVDIIGPMPPGTEVVTTFSAGVCAASGQPEAVRALLAFLRSPAAADAKRREGMDPA